MRPWPQQEKIQFVGSLIWSKSLIVFPSHNNKLYFIRACWNCEPRFWHPLTSASDGEGEDGCQRGDLQLTWHLCLGAYSPVNKQKLPQSHKLCNFMQKMIETITMKRKHNLNQDQGTTDWVRLGGRWLQQGFYPVWLEFIKGGKYGRRWQSTREYDSEKCAAQWTQPMIRANTEHVKNWTCRRRNQTLTSFKDFWIHLPSKNLHGRENLLI